MKPCRKRPQLRASTWQASVARLCCKRAAVHKSIAKLLPAALLLSMSSILQPVSPESAVLRAFLALRTAPYTKLGGGDVARQHFSSSDAQHCVTAMCHMAVTMYTCST